MSRFVVLLRGVNVGKGNRVPMAGFKTMLEGLGLTEVSTLLNSGNAVYDLTATPQPTLGEQSATIQASLQQSFAVTTPVIVKSAADVQAIIRASPLTPPDTEHSKYLVAFASDPADLLALKPLQALAQPPERFEITPVAAFLYAPAGVLQTRVSEALLGKLGKRVTTRNWATVLKLSTLLAQGGQKA